VVKKAMKKLVKKAVKKVLRRNNWDRYWTITTGAEVMMVLNVSSKIAVAHSIKGKHNNISHFFPALILHCLCVSMNCCYIHFMATSRRMA
jgi:hypothetical protein